MTKSVLTNQFKKSLAFVLPYQIATVVIALIAQLAGTPVGVGLVLLIILILWAPALLERVIRTKLPGSLQINYFVFVIAASLGGSGLGFYAHIPNWDTIVHLYSGIFLTWLGLFAVQQAEIKSKGKLPMWFGVLAGLSISLAFAVAWEIGEFLSDLFLHTTTQAGLEDTIVDMAAAVVGATIALILASLVFLPKSVLPRAFVKK